MSVLDKSGRKETLANSDLAVACPNNDHHKLVTPTISDVSVMSTSSEAPWDTPGSSWSAKHGLDQPPDGSPQPQKRLLVETAPSFRHSAPCPQPSPDGAGEPHRGFLRRSAAPLQSLLLGPRNNRLPPLVRERAGCEADFLFDKAGYPLHDPFSNVPNPVITHDAEGLTRGGHTFWRLVSPSHNESRRGEEAVETEGLLSSLASDHMERSEANHGSSQCHGPGSKSSSMGHIATETTARLHALRALEGAGGKTSGRPDPGSGDTAVDETNPIIMCGTRRYSDWTGDFGMYNAQGL
jgi:hypothetical protein